MCSKTSRWASMMVEKTLPAPRKEIVKLTPVITSASGVRSSSGHGPERVT